MSMGKTNLLSKVSQMQSTASVDSSYGAVHTISFLGISPDGKNSCMGSMASTYTVGCWDKAPIQRTAAGEVCQNINTLYADALSYCNSQKPIPSATIAPTKAASIPTCTSLTRGGRAGSGGTVASSTVKPGETIVLLANIANDNGDHSNSSWNASCGTLISKNWDYATWKAPDNSSNCAISYALNGQNQTSCAAILPVTAPVTPTPTVTPTPIMKLSCTNLGDINLDGKINGVDVVWVQKIAFIPATNDAPYTPEQIRRADVNRDGKVDVYDIVLVQQKNVGSINVFPGC